LAKTNCGEAEMRVNFTDCVSRVRRADRTARLFEMLGRFEDLPDMRTLTDTIFRCRNSRQPTRDRGSIASVTP